MRVKKRDGSFQPVDFNKISNRIKYLVDGVDPSGVKIGKKLDIDPSEIAKEVCALIIDGISSNQMDEFAAELCAYKVGDHYQYDILASRIIISNHHKNTDDYQDFSAIVTALYNNTDTHGLPAPIVSKEFYDAVLQNRYVLDAAVNKNHDRDYEALNYFGFKTLERSYLLQIKKPGKLIQERYQHLLMREAFAMYLDDVESALQCYELLSLSMFTHATPTLFNSGTPHQQLSSCFLQGFDDSIDGMYEGLRRLSHISKWAGGIGVWLTKIRGTGSLIRGTNGESNGILPLGRVMNEFARHVDQGGRRKGSVAIYIEPWHKDTFRFLDMKKNHGVEEERARDLFYGLWVPDIFMRRVEQAIDQLKLKGSHDVKWSLMCPDQCPGLADTYGEEFDKLYTQYEAQGRYDRQIDIMQLWKAILEANKETSGPYMCCKDHVNRKSNQKNIGIIRSSNLCTEIMEYSDHEETAVCNLASINLKKMVAVDNQGQPWFDFNLLHRITKQVARNLNRIIDITYYPILQARRSNFRHRPVGIGVQGLADAFILMDFPFESHQAQQLNRDIFETIYHAALEASCELAEKRQKILSVVPLDELTTLKNMSSLIEYYENQFTEMELKNRRNLTAAESLIMTEFRNSHKEAMETATRIINEYSLPAQIAEYQYMNLEAANRDYLGAYSTFVGSPASQGELQNDMWGVAPSGRWDFGHLKGRIHCFGIRNSLLVAVMPTATTAQILGSNECIEPITSNIYSRQVLSGSFLVVNRYLQEVLTKMGLWSIDMKNRILMKNGSIQSIEEIPQHLKDLFKTAWEMSKKKLIDMSADRGAWIDQSQSFNHFVDDPTDAVLTSIHMYGWKKGLKTPMYYLRRRTVVDPQKFSIDFSKYLKTATAATAPPPSITAATSSPVEEADSTTVSVDTSVPVLLACRRDNPHCTSCGT